MSDSFQTEFFDEKKPQSVDRNKPLAARMRPQCLADVVGQDHLLGEGNLLPQLIKQNQFGSIILYGPPGCGKTSLAQVIAAEIDCRFVKINAVSSNVAELAKFCAAQNTKKYKPLSLSTRFTASINRSKTSSCPMSKKASSVSSAQPRKNQASTSTHLYSVVVIYFA